MTRYVTAGDALSIHEWLTGRDLQLRDFGLLESAIMRPQATVFGEDAFQSLHEKAAALLHGLIKSHAFVDGNKRTAWATTDTFYKMNDYELCGEAGDVVYVCMEVAEDRIEVADLAQILKALALPLDLPPLE